MLPGGLYTLWLHHLEHDEEPATAEAENCHLQQSYANCLMMMSIVAFWQIELHLLQPTKGNILDGVVVWG